MYAIRSYYGQADPCPPQGDAGIGEAAQRLPGIVDHRRVRVGQWKFMDGHDENPSVTEYSSVITSYSIHYTKLYELPGAPATR